MAIAALQQRHGRGIHAPPVALAVKALGAVRPVVVVQRFQLGSRYPDACAPGQHLNDILPAANVIAVVPGGKLGNPERIIKLAKVRLGARTAQGGTRRHEHGQPAFVLGKLLDTGFFDLAADGSELAQAGDGRRRAGAVVHKGATITAFETKCAHAGFVMHAQEKVHFPQGAHGPTLALGCSRLAALHQHAAPAVRGRIHEDTESGHIDRRMLLAAPEIEPGVHSAKALRP
jgi:hypothetical protein